jgi:SAM-dependent methyltransferase
MGSSGATCDRLVTRGETGASRAERERLGCAAVTGRDVYGRPPPRGQAGISRRSLLRLRLTSTARRDVDWEALTARAPDGWERDGHEPLLRALEPVADVVAELAGAGPGMRVLDVGAGDGNVALAAARRGASVEACDAAPAMVERGRNRTAGHHIAWWVADVQELPFADGEFDAVLSTFGASEAPRAGRAASELARVTRPGGMVAITAWVPRGLPGRLDELVEPHAPLPDGVRPPSDWGRQDVARARLEPLLDDLQLLTRTVPLRFPSPEAFFDALLRPLPLGPHEREALRPDLERVLSSCNSRPPEVEVAARYLIALGRRAP